jgi:hypothetical protein
MNKPWENENCENVYSYLSIYPVPVAAALWCGIPPKEIDQYLEAAIEVTPAILRHPRVKCLEQRCIVIHDAITSGVLPVSRENGLAATDYVKPDRRRVSRQHLKEWILKNFPSDKPAFLFDEIERKTHSAINADSFRALQADRDAAHAEVERMKKIISKLTNERDELRGENASLKSIIEKQNAPGARSETTYLNIIGALLDLLLGKSPAGVAYSTFINQAAIIAAILAYHGDKPGISERTLEDKFSAAKQSLKSA